MPFITQTPISDQIQNGKLPRTYSAYDLFGRKWDSLKNYDTKLKENGSNISIGQRQLIAFARALLTDPKILILDEATSSVDPYTETLIQDALDKAREGRTTIIIAHRLSTIKNADHIIVIGKEKQGILEEGSHEELLKQNGTYKHLLEMQHRDIDTQ